MSVDEEDEKQVSETIYYIRIVIPNLEAMEIQIGGSDMVQELYHILLERNQTCHRTCFKIYYENKPLDHFVEIRNIANIKSHAIFYVVEEDYNVREARIHVRHLRDILRSCDISDAVNGVEFSSFSCLPYIISADEMKRSRLNDIKTESECLPPEYLLPGKETLLKPLLALPSNEKHCALRNIAFAAYNPPPGPRKMKGDVLYIYVDTCEGRRFYITCCTRGFFVNSTDDDAFNPEPSAINCLGLIFHSLFDLLSELSPQFRKSFAQLLKIRSERHVFERLPTSFQVYSWVIPSMLHCQDQIRADDLSQPHRMGLEDHVPGQIRDWNEELQTTHDMSRNNFAERICRDRAKFKVYSDFLLASIRGAVNIVDGSILAINAMDDPKTHMFIWNNIFFSLGFDVKDHYKELGGDAAAFSAATADLNAVRAYAAIDHPKLHTLGMVIIDYKGMRLTAQSIIPGILERDQEESVVYGSFDSGKTIISSISYEEYLEKPAKILHIAPHKVVNSEKGQEYVTLYSSYESKGIIGNDGRHYLLDLLRTFPPDVNFLKDEDNTSNNSEDKLFPRRTTHKLVTLRQELIDTFVEYQYAKITHLASSIIHKYGLQQGKIYETILENGSKANDVIDENDPNERSFTIKKVEERIVNIFKNRDSEKILCQLKLLEEELKLKKSVEDNENIDQMSGLTATLYELSKSSIVEKETKSKVITEVTEILNSLSTCELDIRFNPDCYCTVVKHAPEEDLIAQQNLILSAAEFLLTHQIPLFIRECLNYSIIPIDGRSATESMHSCGINIRYIGALIKAVEENLALDYTSTILKVELLCRCARHVFQKYIQNTDSLFTGTAVAHFLNCLVGSIANTSTITPAVLSQFDNLSGDSVNLKKNNKKKRKLLGHTIIHSMGNTVNGHFNMADKEVSKNSVDSSCSVKYSKKRVSEWRNLTSFSLWKLLSEDSEIRYGLKLKCENCEQFIQWSNAKRLVIIRRFCILVGIQLLSKDYFTKNTAKNSTPFAEDDIFNLVPVVKHINPRSTDAHNLYLSALSRMHQGFPRVGYELMLQAHNMMNNIYGPLHPDIALCLRFLARMAFTLGDISDALAQQHKALLIIERCNGVDNYEAIFDYINLAHYSFANLSIASSLKLIYRARYLLLVLHGENHPVMGQIDYETSRKFLQNALKIYQKYTDSSPSLKIGLLYHILARINSCCGDFRAALQMEKETFNVYIKLFGENHEKTKQSSDYLSYLTKQAVEFQRKMNGVQNVVSSQGLAQFIPSINVQPPTLQNIIEMLNLYNNFIFFKFETGVSGAVNTTAINGNKVEDTKNNKINSVDGIMNKENNIRMGVVNSNFKEESLD